jgi:hypothetical protein
MKTQLILKAKTKRVIEGISAYDGWHLYYYSNIYYNYFLKNKKKEIVTKDNKSEKIKYFFILSIIKALNKKKIIISEIGSSLLEIIEGLKYFNKFFSFNLNLKNIKFIGIETSEIFRFISSKLNLGYNHKILDNWKKHNRTNIIYDRAVSSYVFKNENELVKFYNQADIVYSNLSVFKSENKKFKFFSSNQYGNYKIFNLDKIIEIYKFNIYYLYGKKKPNFKDISYTSKSRKEILRMDAFFLFSKKKVHFKKINFLIKNSKFKTDIHFKKINKLNKNYFYKVKIK